MLVSMKSKLIAYLTSVVTVQLIICMTTGTGNRNTAVYAFGNFVIPKVNFFGVANLLSKDDKQSTKSSSKQAEELKNQLLNTIKGTNNGKTASIQQQAQILQLVRQLELSITTQSSNDSGISLSDPRIVQLLNGTWYLQYTSPSTIEATDIETEMLKDDDIFWQPKNAQDENVETAAFRAKGTVSAAGITIDTSNKLVQQIFNVQDNTVLNQITFTDDGTSYGIAGGTYRPSTIQPNRAIVAFNQAKIILPILKTNQTLTINLSWIFTLIAILRKGNRDNGWLETTYIDNTMRIGRGNKGTMFILTREPLSL